MPAPEEHGWYKEDELTHAVCTWEFSSGIEKLATERASAVLHLSGVDRGAAILDVGCGPGLYLLAFAALGYRCTGLDMSHKMIDVVRRKAEELGVMVELELVNALEFNHPRRFDLAVSLSTSFGYFRQDDENEHVLANIREALKPGALLILDLDGKELVARGFRPRHWTDRDGVLMVEERRVLDDWRWLEIRRMFLSGSDRQECVIGYHLYSADEIGAALRRQGYSEVRCFGDLAGAPYDHLAKRLIVLARTML